MLYKKAKGEVTVFLTLLFFIISALALTVVESARAQAIRVQTERVMQTSIHSGFGEYNQDLLACYRILAIDSSYRTGKGTIGNVRTHLAEYAQENFRSSDPDKQKSDWLQMHMEDMSIREYQLLSDEDGAVLTDQVQKEMLRQGTLIHRSEYVRLREQMRETDDGAFMAAFAEMVSAAGNEEINPAAFVFDMAVNMDLLHMALRERAPDASMEPNRASKRHLNKGTVSGRFSCQPYDAALFDAYLKQYFSTYTKPVSHALLQCEWEYMIAGKVREEDNLRECARMILAQREKRNLDGFWNNEEILHETEELSMEICAGGRGDPYYTQMSLLYAWAYAESVVEVSRLLHGGKAGMENYSNPPVVPLRELSSFISYCASGGGSGESYEDYLAGLLANIKRRTKIMRCMDLIEQNIHRAGHKGFCVDASVTYFKAKMSVGSDYGRGYQIEREYGYMFP